MSMILRVLVAVLGVGALFGVSQHWFKLDMVAAERGMVAVGTIGRANLRADVGGIFLSIGLFALIAAWHRSAALAGWTALLVGCALFGRIISAAFDGIDRVTAAPIMIEAICVTIFVAAWRVWRKPVNFS